jgi:hypothetical protein
MTVVILELPPMVVKPEEQTPRFEILRYLIVDFRSALQSVYVLVLFLQPAKMIRSQLYDSASFRTASR